MPYLAHASTHKKFLSWTKHTHTHTEVSYTALKIPLKFSTKKVCKWRLLTSSCSSQSTKSSSIIILFFFYFFLFWHMRTLLSLTSRQQAPTENMFGVIDSNTNAHHFLEHLKARIRKCINISVSGLEIT